MSAPAPDLSSAPTPVAIDHGSVWLVVLNWNGVADTLELCRSLAEVTYGDPAQQPRRPTVLVVDNGSIDGSVERLRRHLGDHIRVIETGANLGFAGGNNAGLQLALSEGADVIGVINNDTVVEPEFLEPLLRELAEHPRAAVSPDIRYADRPLESWFRGARIDERSGCPVHVDPDEQYPSSVDRVTTPVLTGCCILANRQTWLEVGLFDPELFLIFEDCDWSQRAVAYGISLWVIPASRLRHKVSASFKGEAALLGSYYFARNGFVFVSRHFGNSTATRFAAHRVLRPALTGVIRGSAASALLSLLGLAHALIGRSGPAGPWTTQIARHVASKSTTSIMREAVVALRGALRDSIVGRALKPAVRWRRDVWSDLRLRLLTELGSVPSHSVRNYFYRRAGVTLPPTSSIHWRAEFYNPAGVIIGENCTIGDTAFLDGREGITFGDNVNVGSHVSIYTRQHDVDSPDFAEVGAPVSVGDYAWIASHAVVLPGVTIGEGAVVAAGAVVTRDVPEFVLVGGNPAVFIRDRSRQQSYRLGYAKRFV